MILVAAVSLTIVFVFVIKNLLPAAPNLTKQLSTYDAVARVRIDHAYVPSDAKSRLSSKNFVYEFFAPAIEAVSSHLVKLVASESDSELALRLRRAGMDVDANAYRLSVVKTSLALSAAGFFMGVAIGKFAAMIFLPLLFGFIGISKSRGAVDKKIEARCLTIRLEMYSINQLLALHIRTGSGAIQALQAVSNRTRGIVAEECTSVLARVRAGMSIDESLHIAAKNTAEPHAVRTYKLLAATSQRGVDLTQGLLDLANDLRRSLREDIKATSAKRRAAMLIPTIGILSPIMLLFVAAPIPSIVLGGN